MACKEPAVAQHKIDTNFKYGRFCGKDYPAIPVNNDSGITEEEKQNHLAKDYFRIKPIDAIDSACQAHDVCWVINKNNREAMLVCNDKLGDRLDDLRKNLKKQIGWLDTDTTQWRCAQLALDMSYSTKFFEGPSNDNTFDMVSAIEKLITAPLDVVYAGIFTLSSVFENYPRQSERCLATVQPIPDSKLVSDTGHTLTP